MPRRERAAAPPPQNSQMDSSASRQDRPSPDRDRIAQRAYQRFEMRGGAPGFDQEDWFEAERELSGQ